MSLTSFGFFRFIRSAPPPRDGRALADQFERALGPKHGRTGPIGRRAKPDQQEW